jgi:hypothetical protein
MSTVVHQQQMVPNAPLTCRPPPRSQSFARHVPLRCWRGLAPGGGAHPIMKITTFGMIVAFTGLSFCGCAEFGRKLAASDGLIDFVIALSGPEQIDAYPVERISNQSGMTGTVHAGKDAQGVFVYGHVTEVRPKAVRTAWSHIVVVVVLNSKGQSSQRIATRLSELSTRPRSIARHFRFFVRLPFVPPAGSMINVAFHKTSQKNWR